MRRFQTEPLAIDETSALRSILEFGEKVELGDTAGPRVFIAENAAAYVALGGSQCLICEMPRRFCTQVVCRNISGRPPVYVYWREEA